MFKLVFNLGFLKTNLIKNTVTFVEIHKFKRVSVFFFGKIKQMIFFFSFASKTLYGSCKNVFTPFISEIFLFIFLFEKQFQVIYLLNVEKDTALSKKTQFVGW